MISCANCFKAVARLVSTAANTLYTRARFTSWSPCSRAGLHSRVIQRGWARGPMSMGANSPARQRGDKLVTGGRGHHHGRSCNRSSAIPLDDVVGNPVRYQIHANPAAVGAIGVVDRLTGPTKGSGDGGARAGP